MLSRAAAFGFFPYSFSRLSNMRLTIFYPFLILAAAAAKIPKQEEQPVSRPYFTDSADPPPQPPAPACTCDDNDNIWTCLNATGSYVDFASYPCSSPPPEMTYGECTGHNGPPFCLGNPEYWVCLYVYGEGYTHIYNFPDFPCPGPMPNSTSISAPLHQDGAV